MAISEYAGLNEPSGLIGRADSISRFHRAIDAGRAVAVIGPAGIGKTSLVHAAAAERGLRICRGAALDYLQARPYLPLTRLVGRPIARGDSAAVAEQVRCAIGAALLVLDDLQWSDADTIEALPALAASGPLVVMVRPGGDTARRTIKQMDTIGELIDLAPLDAAETTELAQQLLPDQAPARAAELAAASGGNPLALEALVHARTTTRSDRADSPGADCLRPDSLRAVIEACSCPARVTLARLGLRDPDVTGDTAGVSELIDFRLAEIRADGSVHEAAALFAELALASLDDLDRTALHRRRAEATDDPGEAALHWAAAGVRSEAYAAALEAADRATTDATRAQFLTLAANHAPAEDLWSTSRRAVLAWIELGDLDATKPLVARLDTHEPPTRSDAIDRELMRARFALDARQPQELLDITNATIEQFGADINVEQRVSLLVSRAAAKAEIYDIPGAVADAEAAIRLGDEHGISTTKAGVIVAAVNVVTGDDRWRHDLAAVYRRAVRDAEYGTAFEAGRLDALARFFHGDIEGGVAACDDMVELATCLNSHTWDRAARALRAANLSLAELLAPDVIDELRQLVDDPAIGSHRHAPSILLAVAESDLGNIARADELAASAAVHAIRWNSKDLEGLSWARSEIAWNAARFDECIAIAQELLDGAMPLDFGTAASAATIRWAEWERDGACSATKGPLVIFPVQRGFLDESRGLDLLSLPGHEQQAAEAFLRAATLHDCYLRRSAVRCRWAAGEALRRAGDDAGAAALLTATQTTCERHGMLPLLRRVNASLRRLGAMRPTADPRPGRDRRHLTEREREVLTLVCDGLSTSEIAARLQVQPSTVDSHIRKSMRRLGASNRREAALLAQRPD